MIYIVSQTMIYYLVKLLSWILKFDYFFLYITMDRVQQYESEIKATLEHLPKYIVNIICEISMDFAENTCDLCCPAALPHVEKHKHNTYNAYCHINGHSQPLSIDGFNKSLMYDSPVGVCHFLQEYTRIHFGYDTFGVPWGNMSSFDWNLVFARLEQEHIYYKKYYLFDMSWKHESVKN